MKKPTIAILGGAFDPIHNGHVEMARKLIEHGAADQVWMMPAYGHMYDKKMMAPEHRLEMVRLATADHPKVHAFDYEIRHKLPGSTYGTLTQLLAEPFAKNYNFKWSLGQDNADTFHNWKNSEELKRLVPFLVTARHGSPQPEPSSWYLQRPHEFLPIEPAYQTSSTKVRNMLQENHPMLPKLLHPNVLAYIRSNRLYS